MQRPRTERIHHYLPGLSLSFCLLGGQASAFVASSGTQKQVVEFAKATSSSLAHNQHLGSWKLGFALEWHRQLVALSCQCHGMPTQTELSWCVSWRDRSCFLALTRTRTRTRKRWSRSRWRYKEKQQIFIASSPTWLYKYLKFFWYDWAQFSSYITVGNPASFIFTPISNR